MRIDSVASLLVPFLLRLGGDWGRTGSEGDGRGRVHDGAGMGPDAPGRMGSMRMIELPSFGGAIVESRPEIPSRSWKRSPPPGMALPRPARGRPASRRGLSERRRPIGLGERRRSILIGLGDLRLCRWGLGERRRPMLDGGDDLLLLAPDSRNPHLSSGFLARGGDRPLLEWLGRRSGERERWRFCSGDRERRCGAARAGERERRRGEGERGRRSSGERLRRGEGERARRGGDAERGRPRADDVPGRRCGESGRRLLPYGAGAVVEGAGSIGGAR